MASNCSVGGVGTCCDYVGCFTLQQINELNASRTGGVTVEEGCPPPRAEYGPCTHTSGAVTMKDGLCCYQFRHGSCCGRPFVVGGHDRRAALSARDDWQSPAERATGELNLAVASREALARAWAEDALLEHASIASFNWFALELLQLGAPHELVAAAQQAALDETRHAQLCFELASRFAGVFVGPSSLCIEGLSPRSLSELAAAVLLEGGIGETLAAALAEAQLACCGDALAERTLSIIAADEADHAVLAWRFLRYAVARGGEAVVESLRQALAGAPRSLATNDVEVPVAVWNHHGRLTPAQQREVVEQTWAELIAPAVAALCDGDISRQIVARTSTRATA